MFGRKKAFVFDDDKKLRFATAIAEMLELQILDPNLSIEDATGRINRKALGYIYGFVDCALRGIGQDMADVSVGVPVLFHVLRHLFPDHERVYMGFLLDHLKDEMIRFGMMTGGQQYADYKTHKRYPMGLGRFLFEGDGHQS